MFRRDVLKSVMLLPILPELITNEQVKLPIGFIVEIKQSCYQYVEYEKGRKCVKKLQDAIDWVEANEINCKYRYVLCLHDYYLGLVTDEELNQKTIDYWFTEMKRDRYKRDKAWAHEMIINPYQ